ncbi:MAG: DNA translocase FtsK 4TM domain-containing protein, partial [Poseidonibacter sp.]|uniref:DNA translocase FtsK 4TM domain-containing protein n=1 Tax=Poseidonibacter sp. TaxID=2321188 RepID=UPI00359E2874
MVGTVGTVFANNSHEYFGFLAYFYLFLFIYTLYIINFKKQIKGKDLTLNISVILLLFFVALMFQSLIVSNGIYSGEIGNILVDSLSPFIGRAGLYIFVLVGFIISFYVISENSNYDYSRITNRIKVKNNKQTNKYKNIEDTRKPRVVEQNDSIKEDYLQKEEIFVNTVEKEYIIEPVKSNII